MNAQAECGMTVFLAVDHHLVSIGKHRRIAIGGGKRQQHHVAGLDRATADGGFLHYFARHGDGGIGTEEFLDRGRHQFRLGNQPLAIRWGLCQMPE